MGHRQSIEIAGVGHVGPIPMGCRVGNVVCTSAIMGADPSSGELPADGAAQVRCAFANVGAVLAAGGACAEDVVSMKVFLADDGLRDAMNAAWVEMFPDPNDRPVRHTTRHDLPGGMLVQIEVLAVV